MEGYPKDTISTIEDFRQSNWKTVIESLPREGYASIWQAFSSAARTAIESGNLSVGKVLWLLADTCSMILNPTSANEPFKPFMVVEGKRSSLPEDFDDSDVLLLAQISEEVDDPWIKARLADLVWLLKKPRDFKYALLAIDAYRSIPLNSKTWIHGGRECWQRTIFLTRMLRGGAGDRNKEIEAAIISAFESDQKENEFFPLWLSDLLLDNGLAQDRTLNIASILGSLGKRFDSDGDLIRGREYFIASAKWFSRANDETNWTEMTVHVAENLVKEAISRIASEKPSHMVAASFYENAIQTYRTIPRAKRPAYKVDERIDELLRLMKESGEKSLDEMGSITTPGVDISRTVDQAQTAVKGKTLIEAMRAFAGIVRTPKEGDLRESAKKMLRDHPIHALFSLTHLSRDGRVIGKRSGMVHGDPDSPESESAVWHQMLKQYEIAISIAVQGCILPALELLHLEHRLRESDFIALAANSPIVPKGRERLFGKALYFGYEQDFASALHLLVPQIENMVRWHLKSVGAKTTNVDEEGIENENGLSSLMELAEVPEIFGDDLAFEIKALFCDSFGANLRNEVAHGLADDALSFSTFSIYGWWFAFKIVFSTFWNRKISKNVSSRTEDDKISEGTPESK